MKQSQLVLFLHALIIYDMALSIGSTKLIMILFILRVKRVKSSEECVNLILFISNKYPGYLQLVL